MNEEFLAIARPCKAVRKTQAPSYYIDLELDIFIRLDGTKISMKMNPVIHFEMPAENRKRMANFYTRAFGWQTKQLGPEMGEYVVVTTAESDEKGPTKPGMINGGFFQKTDDKPSQYPSVVIQVDDIKDHMNKIEEAGGKVLGEPWDIPGIGLYVSFLDTEGNRASIIQPSRQ